ncbi:MAG: hypothetical protein COA52_10230 [Hyphomicrobiales bacterium]|nr:CRTAC1 family protein [Hyphomicrobiales bacterium]PCJ90481.1 MAG: hypothetical protein COA52_10230 [Hyphomicrobiales bacterium]
MTKSSFALCCALLFASNAVQADDRSDALDLLSIPHFTEQAASAGLSQTYDGGWEFFVGGGGSSLDCNGDGMPDIALAGGTNAAALFINTGKAGGELSFTRKAFDLPEKLTKNVLGIYALDINADAQDDLVLLRLGENIVLQGMGGCKFERANRKWNIDGGRSWTTAFAATWEPEQRFPTLAFGNYVDRTAPGSPWGTCDANYLMRPSGGDTPNYDNVAELSPGYCALSMLFTDWNRSGEPALRIANDRQYYRGGEEQLWRVEPNRPPRLYRRADGWEHLKIWGMGIAEADLNSDGLPEYAITSMGDTKLQSLDDPADASSPQYTDIAYERGATATQPYAGPDKLPSTGWHVEFADFNNDGRQDLFVAKGNVEAMPDFASFDPDNLLLQSIDKRFVESGDRAGIALNTSGRGAIIEDFNRDGLLDMLVINRKQNVSLFRNLGRETDWGHRPLGNWVEIELHDKGGNTHAIGARLLVKTGTISMNRTIKAGAGHASGHSGVTHIGLGLLDRATVRVQWPDGSWSHDYRFLANQHIIIKRDESDVIYRLID